MNDLKPGQELTYEQVMSLPDGARFTIFWGNEPDFYSITVNRAAPSNLTFAGFSVYLLDMWGESGWHSARLASLPRDSQEIISEKLSQSAAEQAPGPTTKESSAVEPAKPERQASEIEKRAAVALLSERADFLQMSVTNLEGAPVSNSVLYTWARFYTEAYDYAKSIGAI